jgi:hypothetical protein
MSWKRRLVSLLFTLTLSTSNVHSAYGSGSEVVLPDIHSYKNIAEKVQSPINSPKVTELWNYISANRSSAQYKRNLNPFAMVDVGYSLLPKVLPGLEGVIETTVVPDFGIFNRVGIQYFSKGKDYIVFAGGVVDLKRSRNKEIRVSVIYNPKVGRDSKLNFNLNSLTMFGDMEMITSQAKIGGTKNRAGTGVFGNVNILPKVNQYWYDLGIYVEMGF